MTEFVACPACGTRIKAGRAHCLRCFEPIPAPGTSPPPSIGVSLGWSPGKQLMVLGGAAVVALALVVVIWQTRLETPDDIPSQTTAQPAPPPPAAPARSPRVTAPVTVVEPRVEPERPPNGDERFIDSPGASTDGDTNRLEQIADHFRVGRAAADANQWSRAIEAYGAAARLSPSDPAAQYNFALALHRRGDERDAVAAFLRAIVLAPNEAAFRLPLAAAYENLGQAADAVREYRTFLVAEPNDPDVGRVRGRIEALSMGAPASGTAR